MLRDKLNGMIEVSRLKEEKAGELFLGFRIGLFQFFEPPDYSPAMAWVPVRNGPLGL